MEITSELSLEHPGNNHSGNIRRRSSNDNFSTHSRNDSVRSSGKEEEEEEKKEEEDTEENEKEEEEKEKKKEGEEEEERNRMIKEMHTILNGMQAMIADQEKEEKSGEEEEERRKKREEKEEEKEKENRRIVRELYKASVEGNYSKFRDGINIKGLLTPNKNTVLHLHLTSTTSQTTSQHSSVSPLVRKFQGMFCDLTTQKVEPTVSESFVQQLLDKCADLVLVPNSMGETPLHLAARYGHTTIVNLLIQRAQTLPNDNDTESGISMQQKLIRLQTNSGDTALHEAVRHNHIEVVDFLLEQKDTELPNIANKEEETALYLAAERQYLSMVRKILEKVESPAYQGPDDRTALHAAVIQCDLGMVYDLLKNEHLRAAVEHRDKRKMVPLHHAMKTGNQILTKWLLAQDKNTAYMRDEKGRTALHIAAKYGHSIIVEMILNYYPDCSELVDKNGNNALHYAVVAERDSVVTTIMRNLSLSNLYNEENKRGNTPLLLVAESRIRSKDLIFHNRVDKLAVNRSGKTALDVAYSTVESSPLRKQSTIKWLEKVGAKRSQRVNNAESNNDDSAMLTFTEEAQNSHLIVATLIATVTFAAAFTLPGGNYQDGDHKGSPILKDKPSFKAFIVSNTMAMIMATSAAFIHLFSPLNKAKWLDYYFSEAAFSFTMVAIVTMIVAFVTGLYVVLGSSSSVGIAAITIGLSFFFVFRQVLRMSFKGSSLLTFFKNIANVILFPFLRFASRPFGLFFLLFRRPSHRPPRDLEMHDIPWHSRRIISGS